LARYQQSNAREVERFPTDHGREEAARLCGRPIGALKVRVSRARKQLAKTMDE
jgi:DNA-directed RNA polymerase specialized sigma24 family protein